MALSTALFVLVLGGSCASQQKTRDRIQTLQDQALEEAKAGQASAARTRLLEAEKLAGEWGLGRDPVTSRTRMALGAIYAHEFKDEKRAIAYMSEALEATPDARLPATMASPRARKALALARQKVAGGPAEGEGKSTVMAETAAEATGPLDQVAESPAAEKEAEKPAAKPTAAEEKQAKEEAARAAAVAEKQAKEEAVRAAAAEKQAKEEAAREAVAEQRRAREEAARAAAAEKQARQQAAIAKAAAERQAREEAAREAAAERLRVAREAADRAAEAEKRAREEAARAKAAAERLAREAAGGGAAPEPASSARSVAERLLEEPKSPEAGKKDDVLSILTEERSAALARTAAAAAKTAAAAAKINPYPEGRVDPVYCPFPLETPPEEEVILRCAIRPDVRASGLVLHYRPAGSETFVAVTMPRADRGWYRGVVPASATSGKSLQFYIEAKGAEASSGSAESPNILIVKDGAMPVDEAVAKEVGGGDTGGGGEPSEELEASSDENPLASADAERFANRGRRRLPGKFFVSMGVGTAYGWQPGGKLEFRQEREISSGGLPGGMFHLLPEVGYQLMLNLSISMQARLQYVPEDGFGDPIGGTPANRAFSMLFRGTYTIDVLEDKLQALVTACVGGGDGFRLRVPADRSVELVRSDTVRGGPLLFGVGGGAVYNINRRFSIPTEVRTIIGFPSTALAFEVGSGVAFAF